MSDTGIRLKRKRSTRKYLKDPNLCRFPGRGSEPSWPDSLGNHYVEVSRMYGELLRTLPPAIEHDDRPGDPMVQLLPNVGSFYPCGFDSTYHLMTPEQQELVSDFYIAVGNAISTAYNRGLEHGQDLLGQLARGEISIGDFEKPHKRCPHCKIRIPTGNRECSNCREEVGDDAS